MSDMNGKLPAQRASTASVIASEDEPNHTPPVTVDDIEEEEMLEHAEEVGMSVEDLYGEDPEYTPGDLVEQIREREEDIHRLLGYMRPVKEGDEAFLAAMTNEEIQTLLNHYASILRVTVPEKYSEPIDKFINEIKNSASHKARLHVVRTHISQITKLAQHVERAFKCDPIVNALSAGTFQQAAEQAISECDILKHGIAELGKLLNFSSAVNDQPMSVREMMHVLRMASAQVDVGAKFRESGSQALHRAYSDRDTYREEAKDYRARYSEMAASRREDIESSRVIPEDMTKVILVTDQKGRFLAKRKGKAGAKKTLGSYYWTPSYKSALKFKLSSSANNLVDLLISKEVNRISFEPGPITLRGVDIQAIALSRVGVVLNI